MNGLISGLKQRLGRLRRNHVHLTVRGGNGAATFGVVGTPRVAAHFSRLYSGVREYRAITGVHLDDGAAFARETTRRHGMTVLSEVDLPPSLVPEVLRVPSWVGLNVPIPQDLDVLERSLTRTARSNVSKVRKNGFTYEICTDRAWAPTFHRDYHVVSIAGRHGEEGFVVGQREIRRMLDCGQCEFLRVMRAGRCEAALLAYWEDQSYCLGRIGWRGGDPALVKDGALAAIYWFSFARGRELGCTELRLGGTPPYVADGVLLAKSHWGGRLTSDAPAFPERYLHLDPAHPDCRRMFAAHSFIALNPARAFVVFSGRSPEEAAAPEVITSQLAAWYRLREIPAPWSPCEDAAVPVSLRPWFEKVPLPKPQPAQDEPEPVAPVPRRRRQRTVGEPSIQ